MRKLIKENKILFYLIISWVIMLTLFCIWCITGNSYSELLRGIFL